MARFPLEYDVELERGTSSPQEIHAGNRPPILAGPPPEFGGSDGWWSPEHLLVSATSACFTATFFAIAERAHLSVGAYDCRAKGVLDRTESGPAFTSIRLSVRVKVAAQDAQRARDLLGDAKARCFVANSLRCPVDLTVEVDQS